MYTCTYLGMYGKRFNGYMGVGIAVPLDKYDIQKADITTIADTKRFPRKERQNFIFTFFVTLLRKIGLLSKPEQVVLPLYFLCICMYAYMHVYRMSYLSC